MISNNDLNESISKSGIKLPDLSYAVMDKKITTEDILQACPYEVITIKGNTSEMYIYENGLYKPEGKDILRGWISRCGLIEKWSKHIENEVIGLLEARCIVDRKEINQTKYLNFKNCLFDLDNLEPLPHTSKVYTTIQFPIKYNPEARCPGINNFLNDILSVDGVRIVKEMMAYCLINENKLGKAFMLNGTGANGKTVVLNILNALLSEDNISHYSLQTLSDDKFATAYLYGKLANVCSDIPSKPIEEDSIFKALATEDTITAAKKHGQPFSFKFGGKMIFSSNEIPRHFGSDFSWARRWILVDFKKTIPDDKIDRNLSAKLTTESELSGLLNELLPILFELQSSGCYSIQKNIMDTAKDYKNKSDSVGAFIDIGLIHGVNGYTTKPIFKEYYLKYCDINYLKPMSDRIMFQAAKKALDMDRIYDQFSEDHNKRVYHGVRINESYFDGKKIGNVFYREPKIIKEE